MTIENTLISLKTYFWPKGDAHQWEKGAVATAAIGGLIFAGSLWAGKGNKKYLFVQIASGISALGGVATFAALKNSSKPQSDEQKNMLQFKKITSKSTTVAPLRHTAQNGNSFKQVKGTFQAEWKGNQLIISDLNKKDFITLTIDKRGGVTSHQIKSQAETKGDVVSRKWKRIVTQFSETFSKKIKLSEAQNSEWFLLSQFMSGHLKKIVLEKQNFTAEFIGIQDGRCRIAFFGIPSLKEPILAHVHLTSKRLEKLFYGAEEQPTFFLAKNLEEPCRKLLEQAVIKSTDFQVSDHDRNLQVSTIATGPKFAPLHYLHAIGSQIAENFTVRFIYPKTWEIGPAIDAGGPSRGLMSLLGNSLITEGERENFFVKKPKGFLPKLSKEVDSNIFFYLGRLFGWCLRRNLEKQDKILIPLSLPEEVFQIIQQMAQKMLSEKQKTDYFNKLSAGEDDFVANMRKALSNRDKNVYKENMGFLGFNTNEEEQAMDNLITLINNTDSQKYGFSKMQYQDHGFCDSWLQLKTRFSNDLYPWEDQRHDPSDHLPATQKQLIQFIFAFNMLQIYKNKKLNTLNICKLIDEDLRTGLIPNQFRTQSQRYLDSLLSEKKIEDKQLDAIRLFIRDTFCVLQPSEPTEEEQDEEQNDQGHYLKFVYQYVKGTLSNEFKQKILQTVKSRQKRSELSNNLWDENVFRLAFQTDAFSSCRETMGALEKIGEGMQKQAGNLLYSVPYKKISENIQGSSCPSGEKVANHIIYKGRNQIVNQKFEWTKEFIKQADEETIKGFLCYATASTAFYPNLQIKISLTQGDALFSAHTCSHKIDYNRYYNANIDDTKENFWKSLRAAINESNWNNV